jgi:hypothetical protein
MSRLTHHIPLPTGETPTQLDEQGYLLDEDGQLVWEEDGSIEGDHEPVLDKVGPYNGIPSS